MIMKDIHIQVQVKNMCTGSFLCYYENLTSPVTLVLFRKKTYIFNYLFLCCHKGCCLLITMDILVI
ncbi:hypothetical protein Hanom_Chr04g00315791 [Helianthus anomalus]